jgi:hypothetical protein
MFLDIFQAEIAKEVEPLSETPSLGVQKMLKREPEQVTETVLI